MSQTILEINPKNRNLLYWKDLWHYRELFFFLAWRDILVRYKQTVVGISWAIIRPLITMIIFTLIFSKLAKLPSGDIPYAIMVYSGLLPWQFFSNTLTETSLSLLNNSNLLSKIYFPRIILPSSTVIVNLVDFFISFLLIFILMALYKYPPSYKIVLLPFILILVLVFTLGCGLWFAALIVQYRDLRYVLPFIIQISLYISPIGFNSNIIPSEWKLLYSINPIVGMVESFRWCLLENTTVYLPSFIIFVFFSVLIFITGIFYFRKVEDKFADII